MDDLDHLLERGPQVLLDGDVRHVRDRGEADGGPVGSLCQSPRLGGPALPIDPRLEHVSRPLWRLVRVEDRLSCFGRVEDCLDDPRSVPG
ncbi:MAG: hypothetical protein ABIY36_00570 [Candidatus Limnocylindria bacterium]